MSNTYVRDMTTGNITGHLISFSLPMLAGNIFQQFYNMVDSVVVGRYVGANALAAVGSVGVLVFLFFSLCIGLSNGIGILVSQFFGARDEDDVKKCITMSIYVSSIAGLLMGLIAVVFSRPILIIMHMPNEIMDDALLYMRLVCGSSIIAALYNTVSSILRALGDSRTPLIFLIVASFFNILMDLWFVIGFNMGVKGVALATIIAQCISLLGSTIFALIKNPYFKLKRSDFIFSKRMVKREIRMGLPLAAQNATIAISCVALQSIVNGFGPTVMAAYTASNRIEQLVQQPFGSLGLALSTFAGQNFGAKNRKRIIDASKIGFVMNIIFSAVMVFVMYTFGDNIVSIFVNDVDVIKIGSKGLQLTSIFYSMLGMIYVMRGLLNGVGDVGFSMINGFCEVACRIGFAIILIQIFRMDYMAVWYTNGLTWTLTGVVSIIRFVCGKWKRNIPAI